MSFLDRYNYYKKQIICEGNVRQLSGIIQQMNINLQWNNDTSWNDLTTEQQQEIDNAVKQDLLDIQTKVEQATNNKQYQSWIYDQLVKAKYRYEEDFPKIVDLVKQFEKMSRSQKLTSDERNIQNYKSFSDLHKFVRDFINENKKYDDFTFPLFYKNDKYYMYEITDDYYQQFSNFINAHDIAWCVKEEYYFEKYGAPFYLITNSNNKAVALFHGQSNQFKDIHDNPMENNHDDLLIDCIIQTKYMRGLDRIDSEDDTYDFLISIIEQYYKDKQITNNFIFYCLYKDIFHGELSYDEGQDKLNFNGDLILSQLELTRDIDNWNWIDQDTGELAISFNEVKGTFDCSLLGLTTLLGSPQIVGRHFICKQNQLSSLEGAPDKIYGVFDCRDNNLSTLYGGPKYVKTVFKCGFNKLTSLDYCPELLSGYLNARYNDIKDIKYLRKCVIGEVVYLDESVKQYIPSNELIKYTEKVFKYNNIEIMFQ